MNQLAVEHNKTPKAFAWLPEHIAMLGTDTDKAVAAKLGISKSAVFRKRSELNIPGRAFAYVGKAPRLPKVKWTPEKIALLGTDTDKAIAKVLGAETISVTLKRRALKIPSHSSVICPPAEIPQHLVDQFNVMSDGEIAALTGYSQATVSKHRRNMGIATTYTQGTLPEEANALLGKSIDSEIAKKYGVSVQCVNSRRRKLGIAATPRQAKPQELPEGVISKLGKQSDQEIALEAGLPAYVITKARRAAGIHAVDKTTPLPDEAIALLGIKPDLAIAKQFGISVPIVRRKRLSLNIECSQNRQPMTPEILALIGTMSDSELSRKTGASTSNIAYHRQKLAAPK
jgi:hypothetical protein